MNPEETITIDAGGNVERFPSKYAEPFYGDARISLKLRRDGWVEFSGSPARFLQGHNLFGSDDLVALGAEMICRACDGVGLYLDDDERASIRAGEYVLLRVDINFSYEMGSAARATSWMNQAASLKKAGRALGHRQTTRASGFLSPHWTMIAYYIGAQLEATSHNAALDLPMREELCGWAEDKLQIEVSLKSYRLCRLRLTHAVAWTTETTNRVYEEHLSKVNWGGALGASTGCLQTIPARLKMTYLFWSRGIDPRLALSEATYRRDSEKLLAYGIDINAPRPAAPGSRFESLIERRALVPNWARANGLYFDPDSHVGKQGPETGGTIGAPK